MAYTIISYLKGTQPALPDLGEAETKAVDAAPGPTATESYFVWLAEIDGREYAKVETSVEAMPTQDAAIDYQTHDLSSDADLKASLNAAAIDNNTVRTHRSMEYPGIADQVGAMMKYFKELKAGGTTIPTEIDNLLTKIDAVKAANPKDGDLE
jgi:hypothetical protein